MKEEVVQYCMVSIDDNEWEVDEVTLLMTKAKLDFWKNSSKDGNEGEWQTYIGKQSKKMAKRPLPIIMPFEKPGVKIHRRKDSKKNKKKKKNT